MRGLRSGELRRRKVQYDLKLCLHDSDSLLPHLGHTNYLAYFLKHYQLQSHPSPIGHGRHLVNGQWPEAEINSDASCRSYSDSDSESGTVA